MFTMPINISMDSIGANILISSLSKSMNILNTISLNWSSNWSSSRDPLTKDIPLGSSNTKMIVFTFTTIKTPLTSDPGSYIEHGIYPLYYFLYSNDDPFTVSYAPTLNNDAIDADISLTLTSSNLHLSTSYQYNYGSKYYFNYFYGYAIIFGE